MSAVKISVPRMRGLLTGLVLLSVALSGQYAPAAPRGGEAPADATSRSPLNTGRSPASVNPLLELRPMDPVRPGISILRSEQSPPPRWRLMGTCRKDIGMQRSENGMGYGDCKN